MVKELVLQVRAVLSTHVAFNKLAPSCVAQSSRTEYCTGVKNTDCQDRWPQFASQLSHLLIIRPLQVTSSFCALVSSPVNWDHKSTYQSRLL